MRILHENCDPALADDRTLSYNSYLVSYDLDGSLSYDITIADKKSEMFDHYWDKYRENFIGWKQSEGRINPRLWGAKPKKEKKNE